MLNPTSQNREWGFVVLKHKKANGLCFNLTFHLPQTNVGSTLPRKGTKPMKDLLIQIAQSLVDNLEQVQVNEIVTSQRVVLELRVAKSDIGKVIGKKGRTAHAIRTLLSAVSGKTRKRYVIEIVE